jgi:hypothetical protein
MCDCKCEFDLHNKREELAETGVREGTENARVEDQVRQNSKTMAGHAGFRHTSFRRDNFGGPCRSRLRSSAATAYAITPAPDGKNDPASRCQAQGLPSSLAAPVARASGLETQSQLLVGRAAE